jgi:predicted nucleic acid-binding protein
MINVLKRKFKLEYVDIRAVFEEITEHFEIVIVSITTIEFA